MGFRNPITHAIDQTARDAAANALAVASARNHVFVQSAPPTTSTLDDLWIDPSNGNRIKSWDGSAWQPVALGTAAIAASAVTTDLLAAGAVAAGNLAADAINGRTITGGTYLTSPQGLGASVHIYQSAADPNTGETHGVIEFLDGISGDAPASIVGRATPNQRGTSASDGGSLVLTAGTYNMTAGPELDLRVDPDGAGGYLPRAWINAPLQATDGAAVALPLSTAWTNLGGFLPARVSKDGTGMVHCFGAIKPVSANQSQGSTIATLPPAFRPTATVTGPVQYGSASCRVDMQANGILTLQGGSIPVSGGFLMLNMSWPGPNL